MELQECYNYIDKYIKTSDRYPRFVNVNNIDDMNLICSHYHVGTAKFVSVENFAKYDGYVSKAKLLDYLSKEIECIFLTGITSFYKLLGQEELKRILNHLVSSTYKAKIIVICYQCRNELNFSDIRSKNRVYNIDGVIDIKTKLIFCKSILSDSIPHVNGIHKIAEYIEHNSVPSLFVKTQKRKDNFKYSMFLISEQGNAYQQLCELDLDIGNINECVGSNEQWDYTLKELKPFNSLYSYIENNFVAINSLDLAFYNWEQFDENKKWMYFLALKCFGVSKNSYLDMAVKLSNKSDELIKNIFNSLLEVDNTDKFFWEYYKKRKELIKKLNNQPTRYVSDYCQWTISKGKNAIYYLTDSTKTEIHLIFSILNDYREQLKKDEVLSVLKEIYPALYSYLCPYDFKIDLLNRYFNEYKYQKVMNYISSEFMELVEEQAIKRDYNAILPARCEKTEGITNNKTLVYFIDAMGVEYLSFLLAKCKENDLLASITICHSEIPTLTCKNKDFIEVFKDAGASFVNGNNGYKKLDTLKHHGEESFDDFTTEKLPVYLSEELNLLSELIEEIAKKLRSGKYEKIIMISDHGASRLAVINRQELLYEMAEKGKHSGRCCPKKETDIQPPYAMDGEDYWVLANYGRFKGSRSANVEVHGGATLEEVVIPIIEITVKEENYEFRLENTEITFSRHKKNAKIKLFSRSKLPMVTISIPKLNEKIDITSSDGHNFIIELPNLKTAGKYTLSVYLNDNLLSDNIIFNAKNIGFSMNDKFKL